MSDDGFGRAIATMRAGLALGAVAALLLALAPFSDVVVGDARAGGGTFTAGVGISVGSAPRSAPR